MTRVAVDRKARAGAVLCALAAGGCAAPQFANELLPPVSEYRAYLAPAAGGQESAQYAVNDDGSVTFDQGGLRVTVKHLDDQELNRRYADVSYQGRFSANPFTYGNWRDPKLGYTPNRFTVFEVDVYNPVLPKVELFPSKAVVRTDQGEEYRFYAINREESPNNFEDYYTRGRGAGGNDQYRFDQRMGIVREELYRPDHQVFKGDDYRGFVVFGRLSEEVKGATLWIEDLGVRFDEANHPRETLDVVFHFDRGVEKRELSGEEARRARRRDWILPQATQR